MEIWTVEDIGQHVDSGGFIAAACTSREAAEAAVALLSAAEADDADSLWVVGGPIRCMDDPQAIAAAVLAT